MNICILKKKGSMGLVIGFVALLTVSLAANSESDDHAQHGHESHDHAKQNYEEHQGDDHEEGHEEENEEHGHEGGDLEDQEGVVEITDAMASKAGITTFVAGPGEINKTLTVYGRVIADPGRISHIRARFPGTITQVSASIGERVEKGQKLAEVESNESLKRYVLKAPFSGIITARHASQGEATEEQALFTVANFDQVWAEFQIFPGQMSRIALGQPVTMSIESEQTTSMIKHLIPSDSGQPFVLARAAIDNKQGRWTPGLLLQGLVTVEQVQVALRVDNRSFQTFESRTVVFVKEGERYEARPVTLGRSDSRFTEVLDGLKSGDEYVVKNSYLIKADLEKSGASHDH
ncbi:efflux RND transporter periplasmic adaptor subunit [Dasania sp. GY-MA-18]|uniref:Efflux RND transporter periplasmic adaptor subunit n=1 Tax=Dasania phycosphaerae TaxID=2950436 RepID=A0A9J6RLW1_9GAMM|nr:MULTISPECIES: efflux RND transporter periplasmic adaptor subunit [Dasania]MCR8922754.1 efflux RND transporter periplasmic adaptor subunit [Dasania sp. GY-MA-18]MCZ0865184.1 efflux RND transporter periplasmic adaptor subunit [Dasania phycosphaerae]MCZ0868910.1 efflux RND transporter periplasmic adaptor subunit [Dasania phycosphaerae]